MGRFRTIKEDSEWLKWLTVDEAIYLLALQMQCRGGASHSRWTRQRQILTGRAMKRQRRKPEDLSIYIPAMERPDSMSLYNAKSTKDREVLRISKFDDCLVHEASYLVGPKTCDCPAFFKRNQCKHQQMRVMFRAKHAIDSDQFLDFEKREWRALEEIAVADGQMIIAQLTGAVEKVGPIGPTSLSETIDLGLQLREAVGQAAAEVGEPVISGLSTAPHAPEVAAVASGATPGEAKSFLRRRL